MRFTPGRSMGESPSSAARVRSIVLLSAACACSSTVDGSGGSSSGNGAGPEDAAPGTPAEVEALFAPPVNSAATPGSVFGVWAPIDRSEFSEERLKVAPDSVTVAQKCVKDGRIAYVSVKARSNGLRITVLESKSARLALLPNASKDSCAIEVRLDVRDWKQCTAADSGSDCFTITDTTMIGLHASFTYPAAKWLKLSD